MLGKKGGKWNKTIGLSCEFLNCHNGEKQS